MQYYLKFKIPLAEIKEQGNLSADVAFLILESTCDVLKDPVPTECRAIIDAPSVDTAWANLRHGIPLKIETLEAQLLTPELQARYDEYSKRTDVRVVVRAD